MDEALEDLRSFIAYRVRAGFDSAHEIVESATNYALESHGREDLQPVIKRITAELLTAHRAEQSGWGATTDCDRLDEAFAALNQQGIVARQDFSCCTHCGHTDIWDEIAQVEQNQAVEGYVFYHLQCTERAIESGQLLLAYGCLEDESAALARVATKVVAELRRVGLDATWQGNAGYPIVVDGMVWRRRQAGRPNQLPR
jgi:hypothetical protein